MLDTFFNDLGLAFEWVADHSASFFRLASTWPLWTKLVAVGVMAVAVTWQLGSARDNPSKKKRPL